jgi:hypothetical protein
LSLFDRLGVILRQLKTTKTKSLLENVYHLISRKILSPYHLYMFCPKSKLLIFTNLVDLFIANELDLEFLLLYLQIKLVRFTNQVAYWRIEKIRTLDRTNIRLGKLSWKQYFFHLDSSIKSLFNFNNIDYFHEKTKSNLQIFKYLLYFPINN